MKTIKFFLTGVLSLFVTVLLLRYAVLSLQYMTNEFTTIDSKDIYNFGFTFAIQAIILVALAFSSIAFAIASFKLTSKYYHIGAKAKRERQLLKHIEDEKYNELITKLRSTNDIATKSRYIDEYLGKKKSFSDVMKDILSKIKENRETTAETIIKERDTFDDNVVSSYADLNFEPINKEVHKD